MSPSLAQFALGLYSVLLIGGGIAGYAKAGSRPSLIAGVSSGVLALVALLLTLGLPQSRAGYLLGILLAVALAAMFLRRLIKTRKWMPSGVLAIASLLMVVVLAAATIPLR